MTNQSYGESYYQKQCEILAKTMRGKDLQIIELQREQEHLQQRINDLIVFENFVVTIRQFVAVITKPQKKIS